MKSSLPRKQKGAAAIEFALVFVIFFAVFYGMVSYSLPLLMMQSFNQSAAEAVRRSVAIDPVAAGGNYTTLVETTAKNVVKDQLTWIPAAFEFNSATDVTAVLVGGTTGLLTVTITYPSSRLRNVLPFLVLPGIGTVPNLPTNLTASSSLQF